MSMVTGGATIATARRRPVTPLLSRRDAPRVVAMGGGTGLPVLLQGLRAALFPLGTPRTPVRDGERLTAITTVADDGGSSGRLRRAYGVLAPGDIRNCLLALSEGDETLKEIFGFRFGGDGGLGGHSLGNLILTALNQRAGDFRRAVERAGEILRVRGRIIPATADGVTLQAEFSGGRRVEGDCRIAAVRRAIRRVSLRPKEARPFPQALEAIAAADAIVIGPGSLYTSLLPVLLVRGIAEAVESSRARVILVMNLMTEPGETDGYTAAAHVLALRAHLPSIPLHAVLLNAAPIAPERIGLYATRGAEPISAQDEALGRLGCRVSRRDLLGPGPRIRHDPDKLARAVLEIAAPAQDQPAACSERMAQGGASG